MGSKRLSGGKISKLVLGILFTALFAVSCASASQQYRDLPSTQEREMTLGVVQREIYEGMSQADVAEVLGAPNIVTRDHENLETWIYDKMATEAAFSESEGGFTLILFGVRERAGVSSQTQRTLTVVIRFDDSNRVERVSYHSSQF